MLMLRTLVEVYLLVSDLTLGGKPEAELLARVQIPVASEAWAQRAAILQAALWIIQGCGEPSTFPY